MMNEHEKLGFIYAVEHIGVDGNIKSVDIIRNIIPTAGLNYIISSAMSAGSQLATWYIGLYSANRTPVAADTMTTLIADCEESSAYGETSRLEASFPAVSNGLITTVDNPTVFTFTEDATIQGGFLTSGITINNTSGLLISAVKFPSPKVISAGELLRVPVGLSLASS